jgi:hypothetical protein
MQNDNQLYIIMRYKQNGSPKREQGYNRMTLDEARRLCSREDTHRKKGDGKDWFLGFTKA